MMLDVDNAKFDPGQLRATPAVIRALSENYAYACIVMHINGQWGTLDDEDKAANNRALANGERLMSVYPLENDPGDFWIITEADRSSTTILLPSEY